MYALTRRAVSRAPTRSLCSSAGARATTAPIARLRAYGNERTLASTSTCNKVSTGTTSSQAADISKPTARDGRRGYATGLSPGSSPVPQQSLFAPLDTFTRRHVGPQPASVKHMLDYLDYKSMDEFVSQCVPPSIRINENVVSEDGEDAIKALSEQELLRRAKELGSKNKVYRSFIGMGYHQAVVPPVILRNLVTTDGSVSKYSPYQAEIAQGRLESLINFQSLTTSLTGLDIANASLLDEGTAAAEGMVMAFGHLREKRKTLYVDRGVLPQTLEVVRTRAAPFGINVVVGNVKKLVSEDGDTDQHKDLIGVLLQYPDMRGDITDWKDVADRTHKLGGLVMCATDFLALTTIKPPGEWGADIAFGNSARFGVPMGYGGPHAAFFACTDALKRRMPGRLIGLSKDAEGRPAYRLALQTREQHIRRDKATSNICTAQALLANVASMYAVYHGPEGLRQIAEKVHGLARVVKAGVEKLGHKVINESFFDNLTVRLNGTAAAVVHEEADRRQINLRKVDENHVSMSFDESNTIEDIVDLLNVFVAVKYRRKSSPYTIESLLSFADSLSIPAPRATSTSQGIQSTGANIPAVESPYIPGDLARTTPYMTQPVWNSHHSETDILRYMHHLQDKDLSLVHSMIPLGSCTMKLNSTTSMTPFTWAEYSKMHPFAPVDQARGYEEMMEELAQDLSVLTGLPGCSLQPNSGAQGEYAGLSVIRAYHHSRGDVHRDICLVPVSAHGTNPASAVMAGMKVVPVKVHTNGTLDLEDLRSKAKQHSDKLAAFMVTYPSTYGVFESGIEEACSIIHEAGGQVYLDGANFNAMIGLTSPGRVGGDVCHLNLHKTFGIPHGGGGPGMGPICTASHLTPFLPTHPVIQTGGKDPIGPISAAPFGSASILSISWAYIKMLGGDGLKHSTKLALLNANYMMARLEKHYTVKFVNENGRCAHEFIIDLAEFENKCGLKVMDFAKRLQDFGIHPPTCSWPLSTAMLIEPTESEGLRDIDEFCDAMIKIRQEADAIAEGQQPRDNNIIKNAPHTQQVIAASEWNKPYSREEAVYPVKWLRARKFWPTVSRVDDSFGDRNLVCECGTVDEYSH
ncbi:glycine decarboxylase subunit P [Microbotryomycetes sp. JL221]|nr:glycine decarboxylase subunit P [Microbotryomycetes sp. JL221]